MTSPLKSNWQAVHGQWLVILSIIIGLSWAAGVHAYNELVRPKKENYRLLWNKVAEHEQRLLKLESE